MAWKIGGLTLVVVLAAVGVVPEKATSGRAVFRGYR
jgi:hypothetical protein